MLPCTSYKTTRTCRRYEDMLKRKPQLDLESSSINRTLPDHLTAFAEAKRKVLPSDPSILQTNPHQTIPGYTLDHHPEANPEVKPTCDGPYVFSARMSPDVEFVKHIGLHIM